MVKHATDLGALTIFCFNPEKIGYNADDPNHPEQEIRIDA
jgi:hypothetical protein